MMEDLYEILGVDRDATTDDIKRAYKKLSMKFHPDRGGTDEGFADINAAYTVLSDPARRERYDQQGFTESYTDYYAMAVNVLSRMMITFLSSPNASQINVEKSLRFSVQKEIEQINQQKTMLEDKLSDILIVQARIEYKSDGVNFIENIINEGITNLRQAISDAERDIKVREKAAELALNVRNIQPVMINHFDFYSNSYTGI